MSFAIPVDRLRATETLIAFHQPRPSHAVHILLVPKRAVGSLVDLQPFDTDFLAELFAAAQSPIVEFDLDEAGYRLIANGGGRIRTSHSFTFT